MLEPRSVWIIGPPCAGKTTLARLFVKRLRDNGQPCILLDGDEVRDVFENKLGYDPASRRKQTARIKKLVRLVASGDVLPVVAITHPFEDDRAKCREEFPAYFETALACNMKELIRRDTKKLYLPAMQGKKRHVVGVDIPFDEPRNPDLTIHSEEMTPEEMLEMLWTAFMDFSDTKSKLAQS